MMRNVSLARSLSAKLLGHNLTTQARSLSTGSLGLGHDGLTGHGERSALTLTFSLTLKCGLGHVLDWIMNFAVSGDGLVESFLSAACRVQNFDCCCKSGWTV